MLSRVFKQVLQYEFESLSVAAEAWNFIIVFSIIQEIAIKEAIVDAFALFGELYEEFYIDGLPIWQKTRFKVSTCFVYKRNLCLL